MKQSERRDSVPLELLIFVLGALLALTFFQKIGLEEDVEDLTRQVEELRLYVDSAEECDYCGSHNYEYIHCQGCDAHFPEIFAFTFDGNQFCPLCVNEEFAYALSDRSGKCAECGLFYERKWGAGYGLCENCGSELLGYCDFCVEMEGKYVADIGYVVCLDCLSRIVTEMELLPYIDKWAEG